MSETVDEMTKYIKSASGEYLDPTNAAIFFLCQEIDKLKKQVDASTQKIGSCNI